MRGARSRGWSLGRGLVLRVSLVDLEIYRSGGEAE